MTHQKTKKPLSIVVFLVWFAAIEGVLVTAILVLDRVLGKSAIPYILVISVFAIGVIMRTAFAWIFNRMLSGFPLQEIPAYAETMPFQSFQFGMVNMGFSINVAVDDQHLHLIPILPWRCIGAISASIPFTAMERTKRDGVVRIQGWVLRGPSWCFDNLPPLSD